MGGQYGGQDVRPIRVDMSLLGNLIFCFGFHVVNSWDVIVHVSDLRQHYTLVNVNNL